MSTRPAVASLRGVNVAVTLPCRMNVPSWMVRTRRIDGLYVSVSVMTDSRCALLIDTGTVYGPPATWNVVPGGVTMICAGVVGGAVGFAGVGAAPAGWSRGGVGSGGTVAGGVVPGCVVAGCVVGGWAPGT